MNLFLICFTRGFHKLTKLALLKLMPTLYLQFYYRPQRSWGKVIFSQASVILLTGGSASVHAGIPSREQTSLGADTPLEQTPTPREQTPLTPAQSMLRDTVNAWAVRILLECNLVLYLYNMVSVDVE